MVKHEEKITLNLHLLEGDAALTPLWPLETPRSVYVSSVSDLEAPRVTALKWILEIRAHYVTPQADRLRKAHLLECRGLATTLSTIP